MFEPIMISRNADELHTAIIKRADEHKERHKELVNSANIKLDDWLGEIHRRRFLQILFGVDDAADIDGFILHALVEWLNYDEYAIKEAFAIVLEDIKSRQTPDHAMRETGT